jgi:hypothetical protein
MLNRPRAGITPPAATVLPVHFEDWSGQEFERLCFAYILRMQSWTTIDWYGQLGSDRGRDIWATIDRDGQSWHVCFQCANHHRLQFTKAQEDLDKIVLGSNQLPHHFVMITGGKVSAEMKGRIKAHAQMLGIPTSEG